MQDGTASAQPYDQATLDFYSVEAPVYAASGKAGVSRWLNDFMALLPEKGRVLELGCGGGIDAEAMLAHGFEVDPTDGTATIAAQAEQRLGRPVRVMRFDELSAIETYDAVWANASLLHVPREALSGVLRKVRRALKPGGLHFANYKAGDAAGRDSLGRYFNYYDRATLLDAYAASGSWDIISTSDYIGGGYESGQGPWIAITVRRQVDTI